MAISLFLLTLEFVLEMTTNYLRTLLETQYEVVYDVLAHRPRANFEPRVLKEVQEHHRPQGSHQGGHESHSWVCVQ